MNQAGEECSPPGLRSPRRWAGGSSPSASLPADSSSSEAQEAAVFIGAAHAIREQLGFYASVKANPIFEGIYSDERQALGDAAFEAGFAEGAALRMREAVERALERFAPRSTGAAG